VSAGRGPRARKSQADARFLAIFYRRDVMARRYNAAARSRGYVPTAWRANADRHAADLAPIIARLDPDGSLSPSHPCPFSIESLTVRPRRSTCN
jgi:hypothetical protein